MFENSATGWMDTSYDCLQRGPWKAGTGTTQSQCWCQCS